ncbi:MAG TPA: hypothetical protein VGU63_12865, partial [Candidatus Acidoferrales bacterium]|nr:hypothetical protein [Candidatus Acidoferrales bacterium]
ANTAADPVLNRDVDNPVRLAFQGFATVSGSRTTFNVPSTTPSGGPVKELVIEEISGTCPTVTNETLFVSPTTNGTTSSYVFQTVPGTDSITSLVPSQEVRLYADASTPIFLDEATTATCSVSISGYLVTP